MKDFLCAHVQIIKWVHHASDIVKLPTNHTFVWWKVSLETITHFFCHPKIVVCTKICCWNHASIVSSFCYPLAFSFFSKIILVNKTGRGVRVFSKYTLWRNEIVMQSHICLCNTTDVSTWAVIGLQNILNRAARIPNKFSIMRWALARR